MVSILLIAANIEQHTTSNDTQTLRRPLTVHLKGVRLKELLIAVSMTGVVAHVGGRHLGDVQRAVVSEILAEGAWRKRGGWTTEKETEKLLITQKRVQEELK